MNSKTSGHKIGCNYNIPDAGKLNVIEKAGEKVVISLDIADSEFDRDGRYRLALKDSDLDSAGMIDMLAGWLGAYPIASIEDPLGEDDAEGMVEFTRRFGNRVQITGDDYLVTNKILLEEAAVACACNAVLIKIDQAGTISESIETIVTGEKAGLRSVVPVRSGETEDVTIATWRPVSAMGSLKSARSPVLSGWLNGMSACG